MPAPTYTTAEIIGNAIAYLNRDYVAGHDPKDDRLEKLNRKDMNNISEHMQEILGRSPITETGMSLPINRVRNRIDSRSKSEDGPYYPYILEAFLHVQSQMANGSIRPQKHVEVTYGEHGFRPVTGSASWVSAIGTERPVPRDDVASVAEDGRKHTQPVRNIFGEPIIPPEGAKSFTSLFQENQAIKPQLTACSHEIAKLLDAQTENSDRTQGMQRIHLGNTEIEAGWFKSTKGSEAKLIITNDSVPTVLAYSLRKKYDPNSEYALLDEPKGSEPADYKTLLSTLVLMDYSAIMANSDPARILTDQLRAAAKNPEGIYPDGSLKITLDGVELRIRSDPRSEVGQEAIFIEKQSRNALYQWLQDNPIEGIKKKQARAGSDRINHGSSGDQITRY